MPHVENGTGGSATCLPSLSRWMQPSRGLAEGSNLQQGVLRLLATNRTKVWAFFIYLLNEEVVAMILLISGTLLTLPSCSQKVLFKRKVLRAISLRFGIQGSPSVCSSAHSAWIPGMCVCLSVRVYVCSEALGPPSSVCVCVCPHWPVSPGLPSLLPPFF